MLYVFLGPFHPISEGCFVVTIKIGQMNFEPPKASDTQRLALRKNEQRTAQVIANVVQMGWDRVCTAAEVQVVGHVDSIAQKLEMGISVGFDRGQKGD